MKLELEYSEKLNDLDELLDKGIVHKKADDLLCEVLTKLGYNDVVNAYKVLDNSFDFGYEKE